MRPLIALAALALLAVPTVHAEGNLAGAHVEFGEDGVIGQCTYVNEPGGGASACSGAPGDGDGQDIVVVVVPCDPNLFVENSPLLKPFVDPHESLCIDWF